MVVEVVFDAQIGEAVRKLLAYQRDAPIHIRIASPIIHEVQLPDGEKLSDKLKKLIKYKNARITLIINPKLLKKGEAINLLNTLEDIGVRIHCKRDLHAKTILLDSKRDKGFLITSANLTPSGLSKQREIGLYSLNDLDNIFQSLHLYVSKLLKETNESIRGGDYHANLA